MKVREIYIGHQRVAVAVERGLVYLDARPILSGRLEIDMVDARRLAEALGDAAVIIERNARLVPAQPSKPTGSPCAVCPHGGKDIWVLLEGEQDQLRGVLDIRGITPEQIARLDAAIKRRGWRVLQIEQELAGNVVDLLDLDSEVTP